MSARARRSVAVLLTAALLAAACTGDDDDAAPTTTSSPPVAADPVPGGVLRVGLPRPSSLDPRKMSPGSHADLVAADLLYDALTAPGEGGEPEPAVASSWRSSRDFRTWRFRIAEGRTFDGTTPIVALHVKRAIERVAEAGDASFTAARLDVIEGYDDFVSGRRGGLSGIDAGERIVTFHLSSPMPAFAKLVGNPLYGITAPGAFEGARAARPVPSSTFSVSASTDDGVTLDRVRGSDGYLDGVEVRWFEDDAAAYEAFRDGDVDWATVPPGRVGEATERYGDEHFAPFHAELFLGINLRSDTFEERDFRRAIAAAIDRKAIVDAVYAASADPLSVVVPVGVTGHNPKACRELCDADVATARSLLRKAYPDGDPPTVMVDTDDSDAQKRMARIIVRNLEAAGIPAKARPHDFEEYKRFAVSGDQELFSFGWIGMYDSPDAYLTPLFTKGGPDNVTGLASDDLTRRLVGARRSRGAERRFELWRAVERAVLATGAVVPIAQFRSQAVASDRVQGLTVRLDGTFDVAEVWLTRS